MVSNYVPYGYRELSLDKIKELEYKIALILTPYIKEKNETFKESEIEFLAIWLHYFGFKEVKVRDLLVKMFSHNMINYSILNHFVDLGLVEKVKRGYYKLSDKFREEYSTISNKFPTRD